jgi:hypothetical protein
MTRRTPTTICATILTVAAFISTACVKEEARDCFVTITPDWTKRTEGIDPPTTYTVRVDDYSALSDTPSHTLERVFDPATYPAWLHNEVDHIEMEGTTVSVAASTGMRIHNTPGWLFTCSTDIAIDGGHQQITVPMRQQVRQLTLIIAPQGDYFDSVSAIGGVMSGVAGSLDWQTDVHSSPSRITLDFKKITFGDGAGKWRAVVRLLGVVPVPVRQRIELTVSLADPASGATRNIEWSSDLTGQLAGFNSGKEIPLTLEGVISPEFLGPDFSGTIADWTSNSGGTLTAQ